MYDVLIIGGGAAGMSCALVLGSAHQKEFAHGKKIGLIAHQKASHLQTALFNNVLGLAPETTGESILRNGLAKLTSLYPHVDQVHHEKVIEVKGKAGNFNVITNRATYRAKVIVIAIGYTRAFFIKGLEDYVEPHAKAKPEKQRIQLRNDDHLVDDGIYVAGTLAGWRSQFAIASGSGASVATDILTLWNNGVHVKIHDKRE
ncbi:MAG: NAD(P)/FAD-dependent oxidoreductase [Flavobacteriaceae bacterium]|nr:NAD(P)/FAD-dependent oxidoreductase [Flavobacteriaceae bacterium]